MNKYVIIVSLVIVSVFGLFLISQGITGMVASEPTVKELCEVDSDCSRSEVCCLFYRETSGVCNQQEACAGITELTMKEKESETLISVELEQNEVKLQKDYTAQLIMGVLFLSIAGLLFYFHVIGFRKERRAFN